MQHIISHLLHYKWLYVHNHHHYFQAHPSFKTEQQTFGPCIYVGSGVFYKLYYYSSFYKLDHCSSLGRYTSFRSFHTQGSLEESLPVLACTLWPQANSQASSKSLFTSAMLLLPLLRSCHTISDPRAFALAGSPTWNAPPVTSLPSGPHSNATFPERPFLNTPYQTVHLSLLIFFICLIFPWYLWTSVPVVN